MNKINLFSVVAVILMLIGIIFLISPFITDNPGFFFAGAVFIILGLILIIIPAIKGDGA